MKLSNVNLHKIGLPPGARDKIIFDDDLPGFGLRLRDGGKRTWIAQYRVGAKQRRVTIGSVATIRADEARKRAKSLFSKVNLGADPQLEKAEARAQASTTLKSLVERYLAERAAGRLKARSLDEVNRHLRKHWSPLAQLPVKSITRADVAAQLGKLAKHSGPYAANRARSALSALFSWAMGEGLVDANPVVGTNKATQEIARDRVLSDDELSLVWKAAGRGEYGAIVRLLILTGQRREEVGGMLWSEIDLQSAVWRIGSHRTKNGLAHDVPLSPLAVTTLNALQRRDGRDFVFGLGAGPFQGWSNAKSAFDARLLITHQTGDKDYTIKAWRLHDLRRTVATRLVDIGVLPHIVEAILNHVSGHKGGVAGIYNRASYVGEKRIALNLWESYLVSNLDAAHD